MFLKGLTDGCTNTCLHEREYGKGLSGVRGRKWPEAIKCYVFCGHRCSAR